MNTPQKDTIWRHRKGGKYTVVDVVCHTETGEWLVVYSGEDGQVWARPESQFMDGRFTEIGFVQKWMIDEVWLQEMMSR